MATSDSTSLVDHLLIAMPNIKDPVFSGSVIYICEHNPRGAVGLVINRSSEVSLRTLFQRIGMDLQIRVGNYLPVMSGGPVQEDRGFVLHSPAGEWSSSMRVADDIALTTSRDIMEVIAAGQSPKGWLIALGYAGWTGGQLESEITRNDWLTVRADRAILFETPLEKRLDAAYQLLGVDRRLLTSTAGHA